MKHTGQSDKQEARRLFPPPPGGSQFRHPIIEAKIEAAVAEASRSTPTATCRHLRHGLPEVPPFLCGLHPATGLQCLGCNLAHVREAHSSTLEYTCDVCGEAVGRIRGVAQEVRWAGLVLDTTGRKRRISIPVILSSLGICRGCRLDSTLVIGPAAGITPLLGREVVR
jgi:hypothetical protein